MIIIDVHGSSAYKKRYATNAIRYCLAVLLPNIRSIEIEVKLSKCSGAMGYCTTGDNDRHFCLEVNHEQSLKEFITTICHEMIHVKQHVLGEYDITNHRGIDYWDQPWELEAIDGEKQLALEIWEADIL